MCVGVVVAGAVKLYALSWQIEGCSLAQSWKLGGKIRAERDVAEVRGVEGTLHPRLSLQMCCHREKKQSQSKALQELVVRPFRGNLYPEDRCWNHMTGQGGHSKSFLEIWDTLCDLISPPAPLGISDFQFSWRYFLQKRDLL